MLVKESELIEIDDERELRLEPVREVPPPAPAPFMPFLGQSLYEGWSRKDRRERPTA